MKPYSAQLFSVSPRLEPASSSAWQSQLDELLSDRARRVLIYYTSHRHIVRISGPGHEDEQRLLSDYVYELRPGGPDSHLAFAAPPRIAAADTRLTAALLRATHEVASATAGEAAQRLLDLVAAVSDAVAAGETHIVQQWVHRAKEAGLPNPAFLDSRFDDLPFADEDARRAM